MQFGTNFKKSVKEQLSVVGLLLICPWLVLGMDYLTDFQFNQLRMMAHPLSPLGIQELQNYQIAILLSFIGGIAGLFMALLSILIFSMMPLFFLFIMVLLATASKSSLKMRLTTAKNIALFYCFLAGPILIALESKGVL